MSSNNISEISSAAVRKLELSTPAKESQASQETENLGSIFDTIEPEEASDKPYEDYAELCEDTEPESMPDVEEVSHGYVEEVSHGYVDEDSCGTDDYDEPEINPDVMPNIINYDEWY